MTRGSSTWLSAPAILYLSCGQYKDVYSALQDSDGDMALWVALGASTTRFLWGGMYAQALARVPLRADNGAAFPLTPPI